MISVARKVLLLLCLSSVVWAKPLTIQQFSNRPKLILVLVIDQFRADYLTRFEKKFLPSISKKTLGGFSYLMHHSAYFPLAQYDALQNLTCPGHATILTGAYSYQTQIPTNYWYSQESKRLVYCVEDPSQSVIGSTGPSSDLPGVSPKYLHGSTLGDEIKNVKDARVVSVALKDRASVMLGGHRADLALWFESTLSQWVSSQYYLSDKKLPDWLVQYNKKFEQGGVFSWKTPQFTYPDVTKGSEESLKTAYGIELTVSMAEKVFDQFELGRRQTTDLLTVSFSGHDKLGHAVGPNSPMMEELTLEEDRAFSRLFNFIKKKMPGGMQDVVIVLTGDHGVAPKPEWAEERKFDAGKIDTNALSKRVCELLDKKYGKPAQGEWIVANTDFHFYLNLEAIADKRINLEEIEHFVQAYLKKEPHFSHVLTSSDHLSGKFLPGIFKNQSIHSFVEKRSGQLIVVPDPYYIYKSTYNATHFTGYTYDRMVPLLISGRSVRQGVYSTQAHVVDIAPTLAFLAGVVPPSLSEGRVLSEIFGKSQN